MITLLTFLSSCSSLQEAYVTSSTPARIESNGETVCNSTPCRIGLRGYFDIGGDCLRGSVNFLEAFPLGESKSSSFVQSKRVFSKCLSMGEDPTDENSKNIYFDMQSTYGIKNK